MKEEMLGWAIRCLAGLRQYQEFLQEIRKRPHTAEFDYFIKLVKFWLEGLEAGKFTKPQVDRMMGHWLIAEVGDGARGIRG